MMVPPKAPTHAMVTTHNAHLELIYMGSQRGSDRGKWVERLFPKHNHANGQDI
jgi:hypothetical protein